MKLAEVQKIDWVPLKERDIDVAIESIYVMGHDKKFFKQLGLNFGLKNSLDFSDGRLFFDNAELKQAEEFFTKKEKELSKYFKDITARFIKIGHRYEVFLDQYKNKDFSKMSRQQLIKIYNDYLFYNYSLIPYSFIVSIILEGIIHSVILEYLQKKSKVPELLYTKLIVPHKQNKTSLEYISRLKLALGFQRSAYIDISNKNFQKHLNNYAWLSCYRPTDNPLSEKDLYKELQGLLKRKNLVTEIEAINKERKKALAFVEQKLKQLYLPASVISLVRLMRQNVWVRTYRRELMSYGFYTLRPLHKTIAQFMGISFERLKYFACWEIERYLKSNKQPSVKEIHNRSIKFAIVKINGVADILGGKNVKKIKIIKRDIAQPKELSGQGIYRGKIKAEVCIVRKKADLNQFHRGDVLVSHTVATWMIPAVIKCSAIVTDDGGVLAHSAIIAREFRKPSIINTKVATQVLKNGMIVSLDAQKGCVKIIN